MHLYLLFLLGYVHLAHVSHRSMFAWFLWCPIRVCCVHVPTYVGHYLFHFLLGLSLWTVLHLICKRSWRVTTSVTGGIIHFRTISVRLLHSNMAWDIIWLLHSNMAWDIIWQIVAWYPIRLLMHLILDQLLYRCLG